MIQLNQLLEKHENKIDWIQKYHVLLFTIAIITFGIYISVLILHPEIEAYSSKKQLFLQYQQALKTKNTTPNNSDTLQKKLEEYKNNLLNEKALLFDSKNIDKFTINTINKLAVQTKNQISHLKYYQPKTVTNNIIAYPGVITCQGSFNSLIEFISALENQNKLININNFSIRQKSKNKNVFITNLSFEAYIKKE